MKIKYVKVLSLIVLTLFLSIPMMHLPTTVNATPSILTVPVPYPTITAAIAAANPGDTIMVGSGTYTEEVVINKAVKVLGSGADSTFIDGTGVVLGSDGLVKITAPGDVTFDGFTVQNTPLYPPTLDRFGIFSQSSISGVTYTVSNNKIIGTADTNPDDLEVGFYSQADLANVIFTYNTITNTGGNSIVFEVHTGTTEISHNTLEAPVGLSADSIFLMTYNGNNVAALQNVSYNTFNMGTGVLDSDHHSTAISFATPGAAYGHDDAQFTNVVIQGNTINNLNSYRRGIGFWNGGGGGGGIIAPLVKSNTITGIVGSTMSMGIDFIGANSAPSAEVLNNWIYDCAYGIFLRTADCALGTQVAYNVIQGNTVGLDNTVGASDVDARYNYWGDPTGPSPIGSGDPVTANVNYIAFLTCAVPPSLSLDHTLVNKSPSDVTHTFTETIMLSQFSHFAGFDIKLTWDNSLIQLDGVDYATSLTALWGTEGASPGWEYVYIGSGSGFYELAATALATSASNAGASALFTITFTVSKSSNFQLSTPITFATVKLSDDAAPIPNPIPCVTITNGLYTMSAIQPDLEFKVQKWDATHGTWNAVSPPYNFECYNTFRVEVWVSHISSNSPLTDYQVTVNFDPTLAAIVTIGSEWGVLGTGTFTNTSGVVNVAGAGAGWSGDEGLLFALTFHVQFAPTANHIWKYGNANFMTFSISIADATLSFASGTILMSGIATPIQINFIRGDVDCNGAVTMADISDVEVYYGQPASARLEYDLNNDGQIDIYDIVTIATNYGYPM